MDKSELAMRRKGAVLTMDALFALALLLISILFVLMMLNRQAPYQAFGFESATGAMSVLRSLTLEELAGNPRYPYANEVSSSGLTSPYNRTLVEAIGDLYLGGYEQETWDLAEELLGAAVPSDYGIELLIEEDNGSFSLAYERDAPCDGCRNFVSADRHFVYYNNETREIRLVFYK